MDLRFAAVCALAAALAVCAQSARAPAAQAEGDFVFTQSMALYHNGRKVGYATQTLHNLPAGARRLKTNTFLVRGILDADFGYVRTVTADVDARFRPVALECKVVSGSRQWQVTGTASGGELLLSRTIGGKSGNCRIPLDDDVTTAAWAPLAAVLGGTPAGQTRRWMIIDESLGALAPEVCLVHVAGPRSVAVEGGRPVAGTAVVQACGPEQAAHLVDADGRILRSIWQSAPLVAVAAGLAEAKRLDPSLEGPRGAQVEGLESNRYVNRRLGLRLSLPPFPYVAHVSAESGVVRVADMTDEGWITVRPAFGPGRLMTAPAPAAEAATEGATEESGLSPQLESLQREWAAAYQDVRAEPRPALAPGDRTVEAVGGTARLGCAPVNFRNMLIGGEGLPWLASIVVADRDLAEKPVLAETVARSIRPVAPEGRLPLVARGMEVASPYYGIALVRPGAEWKVPQHAGGPQTVLELAREDASAAALVRVITPTAGDELGDVAADQARAIGMALGTPSPALGPARLAGRDAVEFSYEGPSVLGGQAARCTAVYTSLDGRVLGLFLVLRRGADEAVARDLASIRESLRLTGPAASP
jgi:hypothetical protein